MPDSVSATSLPRVTLPAAVRLAEAVLPRSVSRSRSADPSCNSAAPVRPTLAGAWTSSAAPPATVNPPSVLATGLPLPNFSVPAATVVSPL
ncbi:hypothetical protein LMG1866_06302 [Achromobacter ruhlandii]|nr:hypothetical protein LMG1866_06302 [Achromobacter ruhlandii]